LQKLISTQAIFRKREKMSKEELDALELRNKKHQEYTDRLMKEIESYKKNPELQQYTDYSMDFLKIKKQS